MKKFLSLALCIILVFSLFACSKTDNAQDEPINGRWLYRAHAFIQVLTITDDTIERQYMTFEPENIDYKINSATVDNETYTYALSVTEGGFTYDTEIVLQTMKRLISPSRKRKFRIYFSVKTKWCR